MRCFHPFLLLPQRDAYAPTPTRKALKVRLTDRAETGSLETRQGYSENLSKFMHQGHQIQVQVLRTACSKVGYQCGWLVDFIQAFLKYYSTRDMQQPSWKVSHPRWTVLSRASFSSSSTQTDAHAHVLFVVCGLAWAGRSVGGGEGGREGAQVTQELQATPLELRPHTTAATEQHDTSF